ncbi:cytochrome b [Sphingobium sp. Z007]|uniref:cytochrome b n=1 Tax=Sphingobium sp. Z007 TaxID=627495 RepID=UPI000B4A493C|nr:cytochrome b [Sphingobium sp. Z007]
MTRTVTRFPLLSRVLHWTMAVLIVAMLFIGVGMVSTTSPRYDALLSIHRSIGIFILVLVALRLINRLFNPPPSLPADLPVWQTMLAKASHLLLYGLMFALPIIGWAMLSAGGYPFEIFGSIDLPPITPRDLALFAMLRSAHTILAFILFATFLAHVGAALFHGFIRRDGVLKSMT